MSTGMATGSASGASSGMTQQLMQGMKQNASQTPMQGQGAQAGGIQFPAWLDPEVFRPTTAPTGARAMQSAQDQLKSLGINTYSGG